MIHVKRLAPDRAERYLLTVVLPDGLSCEEYVRRELRRSRRDSRKLCSHVFAAEAALDGLLLAQSAQIRQHAVEVRL